MSPDIPGKTPATLRNKVATWLIVRLLGKNRMVTKDYQRGVYVGVGEGMTGRPLNIVSWFFGTWVATAIARMDFCLLSATSSLRSVFLVPSTRTQRHNTGREKELGPETVRYSRCPSPVVPTSRKPRDVGHPLHFLCHKNQMRYYLADVGHPP